LEPLKRRLELESVTIGIDTDGRLSIVRLNPPVKRDVREGTLTGDTRDYP
jgi:hypothetical protein